MSHKKIKGDIKMDKNIPPKPRARSKQSEPQNVDNVSQMEVAEDYVQPQTMPKMPIPENQRESFIVQNVTPGLHYISDIKLQFEPFEIIDLTYEDKDVILGSRDLKKSLQSGILRRVTTEEADRIQSREIEKQKQKIIQEQRRRQNKQRVVKTKDGQQFAAEVVNINSAATKTEESTTAGHINDPMTYAMAYAKAAAAAQKQGRSLDPQEFREQIGDDINLLNQLAFGSNVDAESTSGGEKRSRATYATADRNGNVSAFTTGMTNLNRDNRIAGYDTMDLLDEDTDIAESIDLNLDDDPDADLDV